MDTAIVDEGAEKLKGMPRHLQWQVLQFVRSLVSVRIQGTSGQQLLHFAGSIPLDDLQLMSEAIEQDCGRVDIDEW